MNKKNEDVLRGLILDYLEFLEDDMCPDMDDCFEECRASWQFGGCGIEINYEIFDEIFEEVYEDSKEPIIDHCLEPHGLPSNFI